MNRNLPTRAAASSDAAGATGSGVEAVKSGSSEGNEVGAGRDGAWAVVCTMNGRPMASSNTKDEIASPYYGATNDTGGVSKKSGKNLESVYLGVRVVGRVASRPKRFPLLLGFPKSGRFGDTEF